MTRVKICGLKSKAEIDLCASAGADAIGFVTEYPVPVPWNLSRTRARELVRLAPPYITTTAEVGGSVTSILRIAETVKPNFLQLHGDETEEEVEQICLVAADQGTKVIKVLRIDVDTGRARFSVSDPLEAAKVLSETGISGLAVDSKTANRPAGTGVALDWSTVARISSAIQTPLILAGGLTIQNVAEAVERVRPYGVDVISGVEKTTGVKDPERVCRFVRTVKQIGME